MSDDALKMTKKRLERLSAVAYTRQTDVCVVLENVHDPHNISAVLRTCDAVGIHKVIAIFTDPRLQSLKKLKLGKQASAGANKWVDVQVFLEIDPAIEHLQKHYQNLVGTCLDEESTSVYSTNFLESTALFMGNESEGLSDALKSHLTHKIFIPQMGMVQSLNISVACAICLYECLRQRIDEGLYEGSSSPEREMVRTKYIDLHEASYKA